MIRLLTLLSVALGLAAGPPPCTDRRRRACDDDTTPTFTFKSKGARSFECGVDTVTLKKCTARFTTEALAVGAHKLRVRAVNAKKEEPDHYGRVHDPDSAAASTCRRRRPPRAAEGRRDRAG